MLVVEFFKRASRLTHHNLGQEFATAIDDTSHVRYGQNLF
jgi:hypothetical protein